MGIHSDSDPFHVGVCRLHSQNPIIGRGGPFSCRDSEGRARLPGPVRGPGTLADRSKPLDVLTPDPQPEVSLVSLDSARLR